MQVDPAAALAGVLDRLGPGHPPHLAVAVSGGADSMALALLAADWAAARGGRVTALTVDHALRPQSGAEAAQVGRWLAARDIPHVILVRAGVRPTADVQAMARSARYRLLTEWCRAQGVTHLLLAHHQADQAETLLLRLGRGSGVDGLAAMAPMVSRDGVVLLRPLLDVPADCLRGFLKGRGQDWIEDSSNADPAFARVRMRRLLPVLAGEGLSVPRLAETAARMRRARDALDWMVAQRAATSVRLHPAGFATVDLAAFIDPPEEIGLRLLVRLLQAAGGGDYPPRAERTEGLFQRLAQGRAGKATLAGCTLAIGADSVVFAREAARQAAPVTLVPGERLLWDGRLRVEVPNDLPAGLRLAGLGASGWRPLGKVAPVPAPARASLPALFDRDGVFAVPHLGYKRGGGVISAEWIVWEGPMRHCLVPAGGGII
ncbi:tRNA lysidine(34) synthetase TilS [Magnetospirillum moscoviense]|uniref:tRNA lysidine(34) synthetase TilS n=1 Tax=Magnetospirillum moscoviense TaxID=1437059 RepID=UPI000838F4B7|nr:tRNA lysidine(34) synthetase TilS [Magnetospirillum moscoviense]